jgi:hypothetical protein
MTDFTPTEIAARELIAAASGMGVTYLPGAIAPETEAQLRSLLGAQGTEAGTAETPKDRSVHDGPVAESDAP